MKTKQKTDISTQSKYALLNTNLSTKIINDVKVHPYRGVDDRPYKYQNFLTHPFQNILIIGPKNTGKSLLSSTILFECISNKTLFRIFSTTMESDFTTAKTIKKLTKRGIDVETYDHITYKQLENQLEEIKAWVIKPVNEEKILSFKFRFPLVIYLWDDFRENFKGHPEISNFFTKNRHYRSINIVSTQNYKDIAKFARRNIQVLILTKGLSREMLYTIHGEQPIWVPKDIFWNVYEMATFEKYNFLFVDMEYSKFRKNFDEEIMIAK